MFYSVYSNSCFFKNINRAFSCTCPSVAPLLPELFLWFAETRKNLNILSCIHVFDLVFKCCSDIKEDNCQRYSLNSLCWWIKVHRWLKLFFFVRCFHCSMRDVKNINQYSVAVVFENALPFSPSCTRLWNCFTIKRCLSGTVTKWNSMSLFQVMLFMVQPA